MKNKTETRFTGNWVSPTVHVTKNGVFAPRRKVLTNGIEHYKLAMLDHIVRDLRSGYEVRLTDSDGNDVLRLFPFMDTHCKEMSVVAQSMQGLRKCISDIKPKIVRVKPNETEVVNAKHVAEITEECHTKRGERIWVTPDQMVECPKCGFEFRIGRPEGK